MKMDAAILWEPQQPWSVEEVELDRPQEGEVLVSYTATGLCHSDHHPQAGDAPAVLPAVGGHEGAGVVEEVGPGVTTLRPGDHVVASFVPACGRCRWCAKGMQNLCDLGALIMTGTMLDGTYRRHARGRDIGALSLLGTFAPYGTVPEASLVRVDPDVPLETLCLLGCGITTGWGSAVHTADVRPGDTVVVIGLGGIGSGAVQGARIAGAERIVVVDVVETKRDKAMEFGATDFVSSTAEATELVRDLTRGVGADSAILAVGLVAGSMIADALELVRKGGSVVLTALAPFADVTPTLPMAMFTLYQKRLLGSLFGQSNPRADIPRLVELHRAGRLQLDEAITARYQLEDINSGFADMLAGKNIRGIVVHRH